ncbi:hypothetical protein ACFL4Z_00760 [candidate division KSB1 bacterium]
MRTENINIRVNPELKKELQEIADKEYRKITDIIIELIVKYTREKRKEYNQ